MKQFLYILGLALISFSCAKNEGNDDQIAPDQISNRQCASYEVLQAQIAADPARLANLEALEKFTESYLRQHQEGNRVVNTIEVVVNVLYKTAAQNISDAQIQSQISALNQDYAATNPDYANIPSAFTGVASGNTEIQFVLSQIIRKSTNKSSWQANDAMKSATQGGLNPTNPTTKLNIWVCNLGGGLLGYAQFPGGPSSTDGVVIDDNAFGTTGTAAYPFNKGRTATHEIGHWANLRHIWGDATCGTDLVSDTPVHNAYNAGCPTQPHYSTCTGNPREMTMNYMDYTYDACMYMFSAGQKSRMLAAMASSRSSY